MHMNEKERNQAILSIPHLQASAYSTLDVPATLDYMKKRFIEPIKGHLDIEGLTLVDCGAGYGWLSFAYLMNGGGHAILCEYSDSRLEAAQQIAAILGLEDRCDFVCAPMQDLDFEEQSIDIFVSVETLEHVCNDNIDACLQVMASSTSKLIVLTTPNKLFPVIAHDTRVPFAHWLPPDLRRKYVRVFGKTATTCNDFVSPWRLAPIRRHFKPVSTVLTFQSVKHWEASYPYQSPYGSGNRWRSHPPAWLKLLYGLLAMLLGRHAHVLSPNLSSIWLRNEN